jgi:hypothetical protein
MPRQFAPETAIFESVDLNDTATRKSCALCNANPPVFAFRFGGFSDGTRIGHCCTPCACRALMEMAERRVRGEV